MLHMIEAFDARRTEISISLEETIISIPSDLGTYSCDGAKLCTASYMRGLISQNVFPFWKATTITSLNVLVIRALLGIDDIKYRKCDSRNCHDSLWDGANLKAELRTRMEPFLKPAMGLCVDCFKLKDSQNQDTSVAPLSAARDDPGWQAAAP